VVSVQSNLFFRFSQSALDIVPAVFFVQLASRKRDLPGVRVHIRASFRQEHADYSVLFFKQENQHSRSLFRILVMIKMLLLLLFFLFLCTRCR